MKLYQMDLDQVESHLNSNRADGLSISDSSQAIGEDRKRGTESIAFHKAFFKRFTFIFWLSLICFGISSAFSVLNQNWFLLFNIIGMFVLAFLMFYIESAFLFFEKEKFLQRIEKYSHKVSVIRDGQSLVIDKEDLRLGDLLLLEKGTMLHADARVIEGNLLFSDEKIVFGKTISSEKTEAPLKEDNLPPEQQNNMLWKGSYISSGRGKAIVVALGNDCYIYKTGGRNKRSQRSFIFNRQNNIGRIVSVFFAVIGVLFALIAGAVTGFWVESIFVLGILLSLFNLDPVSTLTEWSYYRVADKLCHGGAFVRNIEAFDGMNKQKDIYFESSSLIDTHCSFAKTLDFYGDEKTTVSYFTSCVGETKLFDAMDRALAKNQLTYEKINHDLPCFRRGENNGNSFSLFTDDGRNIVAAAGYWKGMEALIGGFENDIADQILEFERHGKIVFALATEDLHFIPSQLDYSSLAGKMKLSSLVVFDVSKDKETVDMIHRLRRTGMRVYLLNAHSDTLGSYLATSYDMDGFSPGAPDRAVYSLPALGINHPVVYSDSSSIAKEQAKLVLDRGVSPQKVIYQVKCMFCGLTRSLYFLGVLSLTLVLSVFIGFLNKNDLLKIALPLLLLQPCLICFCYTLNETVRNCNQTKKSLMFGLLCGLVPLVSILFGLDNALSALNMALFFFALSLCIRALSHRKMLKLDCLMLGISFFAAFLPMIFLGSNLLATVLVALFPAMAAFIIDFFY